MIRLYRALFVSALVAALFLKGGVPHAVASDETHEALERRLKRIGVGAKLSRNICLALEQGCRSLTGRQLGNGTWQAPTSAESVGSYDSRGVTALCALALRHSELPSVQARARAAESALIDSRKSKCDVYADGLTAMLLTSNPERHFVSHRIGRDLGQSLHPSTSWWGYGRSGRSSNLSTSQFGALGLWACARSGASIPTVVWSRHLDALIRYQSSSGSWPYFPAEKKPGYSTGTFMGIANLLLARAALKERLARNRSLARKLEEVLKSAKKALTRDGQKTLKALHSESELDDAWLDHQPWLPYYRLYALEKACVFAGTEALGSRKWYIEGARFLIRQQRQDGSWGKPGRDARDTKRRSEQPGDVVSTAFAVLFLLRSSEVYRPTTPRSFTPRTGTKPDTGR